MKHILHIRSSPKTIHSASRNLGQKVIEQLREKFPDSEIKEQDLAIKPIPHLDETHIEAFFTPSDIRTKAHKNSLLLSDESVRNLQETDIIVIEAPMYNWSIPSTLKAYFDQIARAKITFEYTGQGFLPQGLLKDKKAYIVTSSGGIYSHGELQPYDFATNYVSFFLNLLGIEVVKIFRVEGQAVFGPEDAFQKAVDTIDI
ncbi:FMN-dependent NADH-azoreductase [Chryseobacterium gregarium]|uniref:FMN-dependent NADH-azoreductase n=1 Tax=Chryseobacterium gregarium TaxID=456299 RepID=UPI000480A4C4|nr:NAD(P)H-dependent oxidoreductase [Chryseobacterium gregarium]